MANLIATLLKFKAKPAELVTVVKDSHWDTLDSDISSLPVTATVINVVVSGQGYKIIYSMPLTQAEINQQPEESTPDATTTT